MTDAERRSHLAREIFTVRHHYTISDISWGSAPMIAQRLEYEQLADFILEREAALRRVVEAARVVASKDGPSEWNPKIGYIRVPLHDWNVLAETLDALHRETPP